MSVDWRAIARDAGYRVSVGDSIVVGLDGGGRQAIEFELHGSGEVLRARTTVAPKAVLDEASSDTSPWRYAWERNRLSDLVGFSVDRRGRLSAELSIPLDGLGADEFALYVHELARISDWHEFRLAGEDVY